MPVTKFNPHLTAQPLEITNKLPNKIIYCQRSGVPLVSVSALCSMGWPMLSKLQDEMIHPIYGNSLERNLAQLKAALQEAEDIAWQVYEHEERNLQLLCSAIMYNLGAMWLPPEGSAHRIEPSLPSWPVTIGCGKRLAAIASWYHYATSKRMRFPTYRISQTAGNTRWENFGGWLDEAFDIKKEWEKGRTEHVLRELDAKNREDAMESVHAERLYGRVDFKKVWNWVETQMAESKKYPEGRRTTFKSIFMEGDLHPEDWTVDDVEDLQFALTETCEIGNDIMFFINKRLNGIKEIISSFWGNFMLVGNRESGPQFEMTEVEKEKTEAFLSDYDKRAASLEELPAEPQQSAFENKAHYYKALAQWNILKRRFEALKKDSMRAGTTQVEV